NYYDEAIALAKKNGFTQDEAIANERAALFYLRQGKDKIARTYLEDAYSAYYHWGAVLKLKQIEENYSYLLTTRDIKSMLNITTKTVTPHSPMGIQEALDLTSIMKSAQTTSKEIIFGDLLRKMMLLV